MHLHSINNVVLYFLVPLQCFPNIKLTFSYKLLIRNERFQPVHELLNFFAIATPTVPSRHHSRRIPVVRKEFHSSPPHKLLLLCGCFFAFLKHYNFNLFKSRVFPYLASISSLSLLPPLTLIPSHQPE